MATTRSTGARAPTTARPSSPAGKRVSSRSTPRAAAKSAAATEAPSFALERTVTHRLHTLTKLTDRLSAAAYRDDAGIGHAEGRCLAAIGPYEPLSVNDLAYRANLNKGQASRAAQALVDQGLVRKDASPTDGRGVVLSLTAAGVRQWRKLAAVIERRNREIMACLDEREQRQFEKLLDRLLEAARAAGNGVAEGDGE